MKKKRERRGRALVLASNFWLFSAGDRQELDIVETYGMARRSVIAS